MTLLRRYRQSANTESSCKLSDMSDEINHKSIAIETYNKCMDLLYANPTTEDIQELITLAATSKFHWSKVGGPAQWAISDWAMSRVFAFAKEPVLAINFAHASLKHDQSNFPFWQKASLHEGLARALHSGKFFKERDEEIAIAMELLAQESDEDDAKYIREQIKDIPRS